MRFLLGGGWQYEPDVREYDIVALLAVRISMESSCLPLLSSGDREIALAQDLFDLIWTSGLIGLVIFRTKEISLTFETEIFQGMFDKFMCNYDRVSFTF